MITPTVGRVVWFYSAEHAEEAQPFLAFICYVHSVDYVNLVVFDDKGYQLGPFVNVHLLQDDDQPVGNFYYCQWPEVTRNAGEIASAEAVHLRSEGQGVRGGSPLRQLGKTTNEGQAQE